MGDLVHEEYIEKNWHRSDGSLASNERFTARRVAEIGFGPCLRLRFESIMSRARIRPLALNTLSKINRDVLAISDSVNLVSVVWLFLVHGNYTWVNAASNSVRSACTSIPREFYVRAICSGTGAASAGGLAALAALIHHDGLPAVPGGPIGSYVYFLSTQTAEGGLKPFACTVACKTGFPFVCSCSSLLRVFFLILSSVYM